MSKSQKPFVSRPADDRVDSAHDIANASVTVPKHRDESTKGVRPRALFICGSRNQTTQLHQVAKCLPGFDNLFTPYFVNGVYEWARKLGMLDFTIAGGHWREECLAYLRDNSLDIDVGGRSYNYDLVVTCQDLFMPRIIRGTRAVLVQEGMVDPENAWFFLGRDPSRS